MKQLEKYVSLSMALQEALKSGAVEAVPMLLEQRGDCITVINQLDEAGGKVLLNEPIREMLAGIASLEQDIEQQLQLKKRQLFNLLQSEQQNPRDRRNQYEDWPAVAKGVFYDRRK